VAGGGDGGAGAFGAAGRAEGGVGAVVGGGAVPQRAGAGRSRGAVGGAGQQGAAGVAVGVCVFGSLMTATEPSSVRAKATIMSSLFTDYPGTQFDIGVARSGSSAATRPVRAARRFTRSMRRRDGPTGREPRALTAEQGDLRATLLELMAWVGREVVSRRGRHRWPGRPAPERREDSRHPAGRDRRGCRVPAT
jgi:hypothetical protein